MTRRDFLHSAALTVAAGTAAAAITEPAPLSIVDTHQHLWDLAKFKLPWVKPGDKLANVTKANVLAGVKKLSESEPILSKYVKAGELKVVGGIYDLATGKVEMVG